MWIWIVPRPDRQDCFGVSNFGSVLAESTWDGLISNVCQMTMQRLHVLNNPEEILWLGGNLLSHEPQVNSQMASCVRHSFEVAGKQAQAGSVLCVCPLHPLYCIYFTCKHIYNFEVSPSWPSKLPIFVKNSRPLSALQTVSLSACSWSSINLPGITLGLIMAHNLYRNRKPISLARIRNLI